ncbi:MAG: hypothetical protein EHM21_00930 [Chloroflexi bacterium]|nr:MAG: hypothetical protein EHM21_00930 [Chloroflexota bacterium]
MLGIVTQYSRSIKFRIENSWRMLAIVLACAVIVIGSVYLIGTSDQIPVSDFTRDPAVLADAPFYTGLLSNLGVILWSCAAMACFVGSILLRGDRHKARFLLVSGLGSLYLALDDLLMMHETVFPDYLQIDEKYVFMSYFILAGLFAIYFFKLILFETDFPILAAAVALFAISLIIDRYVPFSDVQTFVEDSSKLAGIALWMTYFARTSVQWISGCMYEGRPDQVQ